MFQSYSLFAHGMSSEPSAPPFSAELRECDGTEVSPRLEMLRWAAGRSEHTLPGLFLAAEERRFGPHHPAHRRKMQTIEDVKSKLEDMLGQ